MGPTKNNTGGHLKIRGLGKFKYEGAYKISCRFKKIEGARFSGGLLHRGVGGCAVRRENVQYQNCYICGRRAGCSVRRKSALSGMSHL